MRIGPPAGWAAPVRVLARLLRRNQSVGGGNDPAVAPAHDRIQFARCRESCRRARPSEFRRGPRARRFRPEPQQRSTREWLSASFPAQAPEAASSPSPPRPDLHWPGRRKPRSMDPQASEQPPVKRRKAWECFRPWRVPRFASLTWMPSFERLRSCHLILPRQSEARALLSGRFGRRRAGLRPRANSAPPPIPVQSLPPAPSWRAGRGARDRRMAHAAPGRHRDCGSRHPVGPPAFSATTKCDQG